MSFTSLFSWKHKDLKDVSTPHLKVDLAEEALRWNEYYRVKLPAPLGSDYISPLSADVGQPADPDQIQSQEGSSQYLYNGGYTGTGERFTSLNGYLKSLTFKMSKFLAPTGQIKIRMLCPNTGLDVTEDFMLAEDLTTSDSDYTFYPSHPYRVEGDTHIVVIYEGGDVLNHVTVRYKSTDVYSNGVRFYGTSSSWVEDSGEDLYFTVTLDDPNTFLINDDLTDFVHYQSGETDNTVILNLGGVTITGAIRVYWGKVLADLPDNLKVLVSYDGVSPYEEVYSRSTAPASIGWEEIVFNARYVQFIKIIIPNTEGKEIYLSEVDYYSLITDRVAAEHGHGSGVEPAHKGRDARIYEDIADLVEHEQDIEAMAKLLIALYKMVV